MSNNCLVKTARRLANMFSRCLKDSFFANLKSVQQKRWLNILKRRLQDPAKTSYEAVFKISKRQLFCKSNECLRKTLLRQLMHNSGNCLGRISGCLTINFCEIQGWVYLITVIFFRVFHPHFCQFSASRFLLTHKIEFLHHKFPVFPVFQKTIY